MNNVCPTCKPDVEQCQCAAQAQQSGQENEGVGGLIEDGVDLVADVTQMFFNRAADVGTCLVEAGSTAAECVSDAVPAVLEGGAALVGGVAEVAGGVLGAIGDIASGL